MSIAQVAPSALTRGSSRWLLLCSLAVVAVIALWHYRVIEELRQGLALFYAR